MDGLSPRKPGEVLTPFRRSADSKKYQEKIVQDVLEEAVKGASKLAQSSFEDTDSLSHPKAMDSSDLSSPLSEMTTSETVTTLRSRREEPVSTFIELIHGSGLSWISQAQISGERNLVGQGAQGSVYSLAVRNTEVLPSGRYVVKEIELPSDPTKQVEFLKELETIQLLPDSPYILKPTHYSIDLTRNTIQFVSKQAVADMASGRFEPGSIESCTFTRSLLLAVQALHDHQLVHFDIKPKNLLLTFEKSVVLTDFGQTTLIANNEKSTQKGTPLYMAPEVWADEGDYKSDLFSLGITLYEILTGKNLLVELNGQPFHSPIAITTFLLKKYPNLYQRLELDSFHPLLKIAIRLLHPDTDSRSSIDQALKALDEYESTHPDPILLDGFASIQTADKRRGKDARSDYQSRIGVTHSSGIIQHKTNWTKLSPVTFTPIGSGDPLPAMKVSLSTTPITYGTLKLIVEGSIQLSGVPGFLSVYDAQKSFREKPLKSTPETSIQTFRLITEPFELLPIDIDKQALFETAVNILEKLLEVGYCLDHVSQHTFGIATQKGNIVLTDIASLRKADEEPTMPQTLTIYSAPEVLVAAKSSPGGPGRRIDSEKEMVFSLGASMSETVSPGFLTGLTRIYYEQYRPKLYQRKLKSALQEVQNLLTASATDLIVEEDASLKNVSDVNRAVHHVRAQLTDEINELKMYRNSLNQILDYLDSIMDSDLLDDQREYVSQLWTNLFVETSLPEQFSQENISQMKSKLALSLSEYETSIASSTQLKMNLKQKGKALFQTEKELKQYRSPLNGRSPTEDQIKTFLETEYSAHFHETILRLYMKLNEGLDDFDFRMTLIRMIHPNPEKRPRLSELKAALAVSL